MYSNDSALAVSERVGHVFLARREQGKEVSDLPAWGDDGDAIQFDAYEPSVQRREVPEVPGCFILENVLTPEECEQFISVTEALGYHTDSPVSLPYSVRHNQNVNWIVSSTLDGTIWERCAAFVPEVVNGQIARGINARFRFYRYEEGDFFKYHTDASWPGSRIVDGQVVDDALAPWRSQYTFLILLSDDFDGGRTLFSVNTDDPGRPAQGEADSRIVGVRCKRGSVLCFPHGSHPLHCRHAGESITRGKKYLIRTDILFG